MWLQALLSIHLFKSIYILLLVGNGLISNTPESLKIILSKNCFLTKLSKLQYNLSLLEYYTDGLSP